VAENMDENKFTYAHNDTSVPERKSSTYGLNKLNVSDEILKLREQAFKESIPVASDETLNFIQTLALAKNAKNILEVGCAVGITSLALLNTCIGAHITCIERDEYFFAKAQANLKKYKDVSTLLFGDALEIVPTLNNEAYDFIFLDCAKVQYIKLLPHLKKLLKTGGVLLADDVLLYGWVNGEAPVPPKRRMLVQHIREYLEAVTNDNELLTSIIGVGDGLAISVKR
jgi:predicted O-methyltransferase YrrM